MQTSGTNRIRMAMAAMAAVTMSGLVTFSGQAGAASSGSPITLALISSLTGEGASEFSTAPAGFNARIALQNAEGGVDGHKLKGLVLDDQTSPSAISTAVQDA